MREPQLADDEAREIATQIVVAVRTEPAPDTDAVLNAEDRIERALWLSWGPSRGKPFGTTRPTRPSSWELVTAPLAVAARARPDRADHGPAAEPCAPTESVRAPGADLRDPAPHRLVADPDAGLGEQLLHVTEAQREPELEPGDVRDHRTGEVLTAVRGRARRHGRVGSGWKAATRRSRGGRDRTPRVSGRA
jgi:hypothetical protein